ncbi:YwdI family protein [Sutcliffiella halmapala]|uniref:YwdI family protein n=1 Tax=Sutcliffiella halmapala TaxID=79882 RepID=UPI000995A7BC|nr:YwdI family protein [Sutcliffiella halmapala]
MSITLEKVLQRLQAELNLAHQTGNLQKKREHLAAMKSLCELALETDDEYEQKAVAPRVQAATPSYPMNNFVPQVPIQQPIQPITTLPSKPIKEDEANGDSIFDF